MTMRDYDAARCDYCSCKIGPSGQELDHIGPLSAYHNECKEKYAEDKKKIKNYDEIRADLDRLEGLAGDLIRVLLNKYAFDMDTEPALDKLMEYWGEDAEF